MLKRVLKNNFPVFVAMAFAVFITDSYVYSQDTFQLSQQGLASVLHHQESVIRTMECIYEFNDSLTAYENMPLNYQVGTRRKQVKHYWRKGCKEREDVFNQASYNPDEIVAKPFKTTAFDGHIVRTLSRNKDVLYGDLNSIFRDQTANFRNQKDDWHYPKYNSPAGALS